MYIYEFLYKNSNVKANTNIDRVQTRTQAPSMPDLIVEAIEVIPLLAPSRDPEPVFQSRALK